MQKEEIVETEPVIPIDDEFSLRADLLSTHEYEELPKVHDEFVDDAIGDDFLESPEDEERHKEHVRRKKNDKIFNNSYNTGEGTNDSPDYGADIKLSSNHSDSHLHDPEKYKDHLDHKIFQEDIERIIDASPEIQQIITSEPNKKKYSKPEINFLFFTLKQKLTKGSDKSRFISSIYLLDSISSITTLEYRKLFDMLEYEYKEDLLEELNQKYGILEHHHKTQKLF